MFARLCVALCVLTAGCWADDSVHYDTIVVGAGAAGVTAAGELARAGRRVLALEAQERVGGRVWTRDFGDGVVEVGAEWIHGIGGSRTYNLAIANNVSVVFQELQLVLLKAGGEKWPLAVEDLVNRGTDYIFDQPEEVISVGDNVVRKLTAYAEKTYPAVAADSVLMGQIFKFLEQVAGINDACYSWFEDNARGSYEALNGTQTASWGRNGYRTLFDIILNKYNNGPGLPTLDLKLNTEVTSIRWSPEPGPVSVTAGGLNYTADNVIVTVSLGVLKAKHSALFSPPLPAEKVATIEKMSMGTIGKIIMSFEQRWWNENQVFAFLWSKDEVDALPESQRWVSTISSATTPTGSSNTLTLWTSGNTTKLVESLPEEEVKARSLDLLRRFFGSNTTIPEPTGFIRTTWLSNPYTLGTYSVDALSLAPLPDAHSALAAPLRDSRGKPRVLFAGEATHHTHYSTVHGAAETGLRDALRVQGEINE